MTIATPPSGLFQSRLALAVTAGRFIEAHVRITNMSATGVWLLKDFASIRRHAFGNWFDIQVNGRPANFLGPMIKKAPAGPADFLPLAPRQTAEGVFVLNYNYELDRGGHVVAQFRAFNPSNGPQRLQKLLSNQAQIVAP